MKPEMQVALIEVLPKKGLRATNKDLSGGFGTSCDYGKSLRAKLLMFMKRSNVKLPLLSMAYVAAVCRRERSRVLYSCNGNAEGDLFIIPSSIVDYRSELETARQLKKKTRAPVGFMGPFASVMPEIFLEEADFVIRGEPEKAVEGILRGEKSPFGIIDSDPVEDLDALPFPEWSVFPTNKFSYSPLVSKRPFFPVLSSRGCGMKCSFYCPYPLFEGKVWRRRSVENIMEELLLLKRNFGLRGMLFRDPLFTCNKDRVASLAEEMIRNKLDLEWACETHIEFLDRDLIMLLKRSGLRSINTGIESNNEEGMLAVGRKPLRKSHQAEIVDLCRKQAIQIGAFYILGFPEDTEASILSMIEYAKQVNTDFAQFTVCTPYPGTGLYSMLKDDIDEPDWEKFDIYTPVFRHRNLSKKRLLELKEKAFVEYYFRSSWFFSRLKFWLRKTF